MAEADEGPDTPFQKGKDGPGDQETEQELGRDGDWETRII